MSYKNSEVKGKVNEKLDGAMYDAFKLCQAVTKNSRTREVIMLRQLCRVLKYEEVASAEAVVRSFTK